MTSYDWLLDTISVLLEDDETPTPGPILEWEATFEREADSGGIASGVAATKTRHFFEHQQSTSSYLVTSNGTTIEPVAGWLDENGAYFPFLSAEAAQARLERTGLFPRIIVGTILDKLVPPGRAFSYDGHNYRVMSGCRLDLVNHETSGVFIKKYREL